VSLNIEQTLYSVGPEQTLYHCSDFTDVCGNRMLFYPLHPRNCPGQKDGWQGKKCLGVQMSGEPHHVVEKAGELLQQRETFSENSQLFLS